MIMPLMAPATAHYAQFMFKGTAQLSQVSILTVAFHAAFCSYILYLYFCVPVILVQQLLVKLATAVNFKQNFTCSSMYKSVSCSFSVLTTYTLCQ